MRDSKLYVARHENTRSLPDLLEVFSEVQDLGIRWSLEKFGTERIEVTIKTKGLADVYNRMKNHPGQRLTIFDQNVWTNLSGFITAVEPQGANLVKYIAKGPAWLLYKNLYTAIYATSATISDSIKAVLLNANGFVTICADDQTNIATNATTLGGWQVSAYGGDYPGTMIDNWLNMSDSSYNTYDFWLLDDFFAGTVLEPWIPYYQARTSNAEADWFVNLSDLPDVKQGVDINEVYTDVTVFYGIATGTGDGSSTGNTLSDAGATFLDDGVSEGDSITNITDDSRGIVDSVTSNTVLVAKDLTGGGSNDFANGDVYSIQLKNGQNYINGTTTTSYIGRKYVEHQSNMTSTQATQRVNTLLNGDITQINPFTITAPFIRHKDGGLFRLWEVIARGGGHIRINDLYPTGRLFTQNMNNLTTFRISAMDYDYQSNSLRVVPDKPDIRMDAQLVRHGVLGAAMIGRGG